MLVQVIACRFIANQGQAKVALRSAESLLNCHATDSAKLSALSLTPSRRAFSDPCGHRWFATKWIATERSGSALCIDCFALHIGVLSSAWCASVVCTRVTRVAVGPKRIQASAMYVRFHNMTEPDFSRTVLIAHGLQICGNDSAEPVQDGSPAHSSPDPIFHSQELFVTHSGNSTVARRRG